MIPDDYYTHPAFIALSITLWTACIAAWISPYVKRGPDNVFARIFDGLARAIDRLGRRIVSGARRGN